MKSYSKIFDWKRAWALAFVLSLIIISSCQKNLDPSLKELKYFFYDATGEDQKALADSYPKDSIKVYIYKNEPNLSNTIVHFDVASGDGSVDQTQVSTDISGYASTKWKFGNSSTNQILNISIYEQAGEFIGSFQCFGYAVINNQWNRIKSYTEASINCAVRDTINKVTFATNNYYLFKLGNSLIDWEIVSFIGNKRIGKVAINDNGIIYLTTQYGLLYKSIDHGENWTMCTKPFTEFFDYLNIVITKDGTLWVSTSNNQLSWSSDGGNTWNAANLPASTTSKHICKLTDGTLLLLGNLRLYRSTDSGNTWINLNAPNALSLYVTDKEEVIILGTNTNNRIMISTDKGDHFTSVFSATSSSSSSAVPNQDFYKIGDTYYILIQGYGIVTTKDFSSFTTLWTNQLAEFLFMDHYGSFIVTENEHKFLNYYPINP